MNYSTKTNKNLDLTSVSPDKILSMTSHLRTKSLKGMANQLILQNKLLAQNYLETNAIQAVPTFLLESEVYNEAGAMPQIAPSSDPPDIFKAVIIHFLIP